MCKTKGNGYEFKKLCRVYPIDTLNHDVMKDEGCFKIHEMNLKQMMTKSTRKEKKEGYSHILNTVISIEKQ